jgi:hypothetical protein
MIETLILAISFGIIGGMLGFTLMYKTSPTIKMKNGRIRYIDCDNTEYVTVCDKGGVELLNAGFAKNKNGINFVEYATKI